MARESPLSLTPPDWLVQNLRSRRGPVNRAAVARAAVVMSAPLATGLAAGQPAYGALASMGALNSLIGDTSDAYRLRVLHSCVPMLAGAVGIVLGSLVYGGGWFAVIAVTAVAMLSGMISAIGTVASASGLALLLNTLLGTALDLPGHWWTAPALMTAGGLLALAVALLAWPLRAGVPERRSVATAYRAVADLLAAGGDTERYDAARLGVTLALNRSYDLLLAHRTLRPARDPELVRLLAQLRAVEPLAETAPAVYAGGRPLPPEIPEAVRRLADAVETGRAKRTDPLPLPPPTEADRVIGQALRHTAEVVADPDAGPRRIDDRPGGTSAFRARAARAVRDVALSAGSWRYGLRLALCIGVAQTLTSLIPSPRSYWVALTITFVLKPDFGSVFSRALLRGLGTVAGVGISAVVLAEVPRGWWDLLAIGVLAPLIPALGPRGYAYQTAAITPVILLLSDLLSHGGTGLLLPRLLDSLTGCAIVLVAGYLLWPESWHTRVGDRLAQAVADAATYVEGAFGQDTEPAARSRMRRRLHRDLSAVRTEFQRALSEPPPTGRRAAAWWPLVVSVERIVDATTGARIQVRHGARTPSAAETREVAGELRELAQCLQRTETLAATHVQLTGPQGSVLEPVRREVATARAIAEPQVPSSRIFD